MVYMETDSSTKLFSPQDVALRLGITRQTVYNLIRIGLLKSVKIGGSIRISESSIKELIQTGTGDSAKN